MTVFSLLVPTLLLLLRISALATENVISLTSDTFKTTTKSELVMVKFFSPYCIHCKMLAPEYEKAAAELKPKGYRLAELDCTKYGDVCNENDIAGYPTIKVFDHGKVTEYLEGGRQAADLVKFMEGFSQAFSSTSTADADKKNIEPTPASKASAVKKASTEDSEMPRKQEGLSQGKKVVIGMWICAFGLLAWAGCTGGPRHEPEKWHSG